MSNNQLCSSDKNGETPLHDAIRGGGHLEVFKLIMNSIENKNPPNQFGETPLHKAANFRYPEICKFILENVEDKDKNVPNIHGDTPLFHAVNREYPDICQIFYDHGIEDDDRIKNLKERRAKLQKIIEDFRNSCEVDENYTEQDWFL